MKGELSSPFKIIVSYSIEQLFILEGYDVPISDIPDEEIMSYWSNGEIMSNFKEYLLKKVSLSNTHNNGFELVVVKSNLGR